MHKLIIEDDEGKAVVVPLIRDEITVGRQEGNTIRLTERNVSRRHARLVRRDGTYVVEDLSSYTGTKVNGVPVSAAVPLNDGDRILIGDYKLGIKVERPAVATAPGAAAAPPVPQVMAAAPHVVAPHAAPPPAPAVAVPPVSVAAPAPPAEPMEGVPTIPVRTLADQGMVPGAGAAPAPPSKLVVVTTPLAGQEFSLDRASLVVGRTGENDIVLNHKSISRHHAKVIRDGERYVVVDLESANGVRVNGAEYERIELHPGDIVELGHVKLRFTTADDMGGGFDLDYGGGGSSKKPLVIGAVAVLVVGGAVAFMLMGKKPEPPKPAVAAAPVEPPKPAAAVTPPAAPTPSPQAQESAAALLAKAQAAFKDEKWDDALDMVTKAQAASPTVAGADELRKSIETERQNEGQWKALRKAADGKDYDGVLTAFAAIPEASVYKTRARPVQQEARTKLIAQHLAAAEKARGKGACEDATTEAQAVLALEAGHKAAQQVIDRCSKPAPVERPKPVAAARPAPRAVAAAPRPAPAARPARAAKEETSFAPAGDPDEFLKEAQDNYLKGQFAAAIEAARKALRLKPGLTTAYRIIAVCSCSLKDTDDARRAYDKLDDRDKMNAKKLCALKGVTLD
jgi:pSer/pThr/pTyr-binding forkhead associated (FHA) protein/tetratricopeptide (TPR) repeat protein